MPTPSRDPTVEHEPHLRPRSEEAVPAEAVPAEAVPASEGSDAPDRFDRRSLTEDERAAHSIWDEPLYADGTGSAVEPEARLNYSVWLESHSRQSTWWGSWTMTIGMAVVAGPLAILAALFHNVPPAWDLFGVLVIVLIAPMVEELAKVMLPMICVETQPYRFRSHWQLFVAACAGGVVFAAIENAFYLGEATFDFEEPLTRWRWTVCLVLHSGCSLVAGIGIARVWRTTMAHRTRPRIELAAPYLVTAMVIHGTYNAFAIAFSWINGEF